MSSVLLHLPVDELPHMEFYAAALPPGIKMFSAYVIAHMAYLKGEYGRALGICEAAFMFRDGTYPISMNLSVLHDGNVPDESETSAESKRRIDAGMEYGERRRIPGTLY